MKIRTIALASALCLLASVKANAATTVVTFDNIPEGTIASTQYNGVVITGASVLTINSALNPQFPPVSDPNVVYDYLNGVISLDFTTSVDSVGAFVTGNTSITLSAFDGATLLGTIATGGANYLDAGGGLSPNIFLNLAFPTITSATFSNNENGLSDTFTIDNLTVGGVVTVSSVPEPANVAMLLAGVGLMGAALRRKSAQK